jgi:hypothetical protein
MTERGKLSVARKSAFSLNASKKMPKLAAACIERDRD